MCHGNNPDTIRLDFINNPKWETLNSSASVTVFSDVTKFGLALDSQNRGVKFGNELIAERESALFVEHRRLNVFLCGETMIADALHERTGALRAPLVRLERQRRGPSEYLQVAV